MVVPFPTSVFVEGFATGLATAPPDEKPLAPLDIVAMAAVLGYVAAVPREEAERAILDALASGQRRLDLTDA